MVNRNRNSSGRILTTNGYSRYGQNIGLQSILLPSNVPATNCLLHLPQQLQVPHSVIAWQTASQKV